jgi:hypothetical protein
MAMIAEALEGELDPEPENPPVVEQQLEPRANGRKRGRDDTDEPSSSAKRAAKGLRPEMKISYRPCARSTCGNAYDASECDGERGRKHWRREANTVE